MTVTGRATSLRRNKRSTSQMIVAALVALAVVASLFLIFSNSVQLLRVGLVIALWAATLGAIAMTKYRRESAADKAKVRDLQQVYELQLEREISARREYELGVEARVRGEAVLDTSEIAALRAELAALRGNLEILFEGKMPADRIALTAEAQRMRELNSGVGTPAAPQQQPQQQATGYRRTLEPDPEYPGTTATPTFTPDPAYAGSGRAQTFATPFDEPVTAEVALVPEEQSVVSEQPGPVTPAAVKPEPTAKPEPPATPEPTVAPQRPAGAKPVPEAAEPTPEPEPELEPSAVTGRRSRRRAEPEPEPGAHSTGGLTVAEIMANMKSAEAAEPRPGRRRRD